nr:hypothetical protein Iba_chr02aCG17320 [Ipomoea batatas]
MEDSWVGWWGCVTQALPQEEEEFVALTIFLLLYSFSFSGHLPLLPAVAASPYLTEAATVPFFLRLTGHLPSLIAPLPSTTASVIALPSPTIASASPPPIIAAHSPSITAKLPHATAPPSSSVSLLLRRSPFFHLNAGLLALVMREKRSFISALKSKKAVGKHANFRTYVPMFFFIVSGCAVLCSNL